MHVLVFGGSRNIGYLTTLKLLSESSVSPGWRWRGRTTNRRHFADQNHSATLLLRKTDVFDNDEQMRPHVESGRAQIVQGDALVADDVKVAWEKATDFGRAVDYVVFTLGKPYIGGFINYSF